MKKIITCLVFVGLIVWIFTDNNKGSYSGVYDFRQNPNLVLKINDNNTFVMYNVIGKTTELIKGEYTIDNNNIELIPNEDNIDKSMSKTLIGKVEGSTIKMTTLNGEFIKD